MSTVRQQSTVKECLRKKELKVKMKTLTAHTTYLDLEQLLSFCHYYDQLLRKDLQGSLYIKPKQGLIQFKSQPLPPFVEPFWTHIWICCTIPI